MRILLPAARQVAGLHKLMACLMDRGRLVMHRPHQGIAIGHPGHERKVLADSDAGHVGPDRLERPADRLRGGRLQIPGIQLAGTTNQEKKDAVDVASVRGTRLLELTKIGQRQPDGTRPQGADAEEITPRQTVAEFYAFFALKLKHDFSLNAHAG